MPLKKCVLCPFFCSHHTASLPHLAREMLTFLSCVFKCLFSRLSLSYFLLLIFQLGFFFTVFFWGEPASFPFDVATLSLLCLQCLHQGPASCLKCFWHANPDTVQCSSPLHLSKPLGPSARFSWCCSSSLVKRVTCRTISVFQKDPALLRDDRCLIFCLLVCLEIMTKPDRHLRGAEWLSQSCTLRGCQSV